MLYRSPAMENTVKKKGAIGYFRIKTDTFLKLTANKWRNKIEREALTVGEYNVKALKGEISHMPYIRVTPNGRVIGHEGRHRAVALRNSGVKYIEVALIVADRDPNKPKDKKAYIKYPKFKVRDLPRMWKAQFSQDTKTVNLSSFKKF